MATPNWNPANLGGFAPNCLIFLAPETPLTQHPIGEGGKCKTTADKRHTAETHGALRSVAGRLILASPPWNPANFGAPPLPPNFLIFSALGARPSPTHNCGRWEMRNYRRQKTRRGPKGPHGTPEFGHPALESEEFWRAPPEDPVILLAPGSPFPTHNWSSWGNSKLPNKKGTRRYATERRLGKAAVAESAGITYIPEMILLEPTTF